MDKFHTRRIRDIRDFAPQSKMLFYSFYAFGKINFAQVAASIECCTADRFAARRNFHTGQACTILKASVIPISRAIQCLNPLFQGQLRQSNAAAKRRISNSFHCSRNHKLLQRNVITEAVVSNCCNTGRKVHLCKLREVSERLSSDRRDAVSDLHFLNFRSKLFPRTSIAL